ncbi:MAG: hypothetical protein LBH59_01980 [Planctomycetaceae bacterium]|nr:hypothetical protein [Planctomycetaceae bacterium]
MNKRFAMLRLPCSALRILKRLQHTRQSGQEKQNCPMFNFALINCIQFIHNINNNF